MKMTLGLLVLGILLLLSSLYFGIKFSDGKVTSDPYTSAVNYDAGRKIIKEKGVEIKEVSVSFQKDKCRLVLEVINSDPNIKITDYKIMTPVSGEIKTVSKQIDGNRLNTEFIMNEKNGYFVAKADVSFNNLKTEVVKTIYIKKEV